MHQLKDFLSYLLGLVWAANLVWWIFIAKPLKRDETTQDKNEDWDIFGY